MDCNKVVNCAKCNCSYDPCLRKGACCECLRYHLEHRELPACCFPTAAEATFDRSFEHFVHLVSSKKI